MCKLFLNILFEFQKARNNWSVVMVADGDESCNISTVSVLTDRNFVGHIKDSGVLFHNLDIYLTESGQPGMKVHSSIPIA